MRTSTSALLMVGLSHKGATLSELGRASVRREALSGVLADLVAESFTEAVVLSTCSRTEIYATTSLDPTSAAARGLDAIAAWSSLGNGRVRAAATVLTDADAVSHLFRVTAGLESRLVGDVDVVAQVRSAWRAARQAGTAGPVLERVFAAAVRGAGKAHAETSLGRQGRSLATRAVDLGLATFTPESALDVLVVGSGQMAKVACEHLTFLGRAFRVAARDERYAARLAPPDRVCSLDRLTQGARTADLILCATSAADHVLTSSLMAEAMTGRARPLTVVDLAVPRNVDPGVGDLDGVRLMDLTELGEEAAGDPAVAGAVTEATRIVDLAASQLRRDLAAASAGPVIRALRANVLQTCRDELGRHAGTADTEALERAARAVAGKVLHRPTMLARAAAAAGDQETLSLLCDAFGVTVHHVVNRDPAAGSAAGPAAESGRSPNAAMGPRPEPSAEVA